jgi:hypothetical protein
MPPFELPQMDSCLGNIEKASEMAIEGTMSSAQLAARNILQGVTFQFMLAAHQTDRPIDARALSMTLSASLGDLTGTSSRPTSLEFRDRPSLASAL